MKTPAAMLVCALISIGVAGCGGDDGSSSASAPDPAKTTVAKAKLPLLDDHFGDSQVRYSAAAGGELAYTLSEASGLAGKNRIQFVNPQKIRHNVVIEGHNGEVLAKTKPIGEGIASTKAVLKAGVYVVYCSVPGHRKAGMIGHLTVYPKSN
jgi:plastocyanin